MAGIFALIGTVVSGITNSNTIKPALVHEEDNIGFLRYITPLLSRRLSSRFIRFAFPNSVQTRHMAALLLRPLSILGRHTRIDIMPSQ